ncbi:MAG: histidine phosphatase family protein [Flavisolibacter sp.]|jgi:phosphohistidine phosphatase|nr:histidine phosphatase family protein [Flavisolibacter sp.]
MKTLILVRHAKSDWGTEGLSDSERPLNERGKKDAPEMAKRLKKKGLKIDVFISSPAKRAKKTAKYFAEEFGVDKDSILIEPKLYGALPSGFETVIASLNDKKDTVVVFSHNPGITDYTNTLTTVHTDNIPTCGIFAVQVNVDKWSDFAKAEKSFLFYDYPKNPLAAL